MPDDKPQAEIELKLLIDSEGLDAIARSRKVKGLLYERPQVLPLDATYYDTGDRRLRRNGLSLRTRRSGTTIIQTLKSSAKDARLAHRDEWEWVVDDERPDLGRLEDEPELRARLKGLHVEALEPVFRTRVERHVMLLDWRAGGGGQALIELVLDKGTIEANGRAEEVSEVELELKRGEARDLIALARDLRSRHRLRIGTLDKSARGYMLADGTAPPWTKAAKIGLDPAMTLEEAVEAIMEGCLAHWLANEAAARAGAEIDGLHQLRIAIRRIRSALSLFKRDLGPSATAWNARLRGLVGGFGRARDLDVFLHQRLPPVEAALPGDAGLRALREAAEAARGEARSSVARTLEGQAYADLVLDLAGWITGRGWREEADVERLNAPVRKAAIRALNKRHKTVRELGRDFERLDAEGRHEVRVALKKLRYASEFLGGLFEGKAAKRYTKATTTLQDVLGMGNDLAMGAALARNLGEGTDVQAGVAVLRGWNAHAGHLLDAQAGQTWKAFVKQDRFWRGEAT